MPLNKCFFFFFLFFSLFTIQKVFSQKTKETLQQTNKNNIAEKKIAWSLDTLDRVMISASKIKSSARDSGKSYSLITAKEIENLPVNSVDEILRWVAGVNLNMRQPFGVQTDIGIRGSTFSQILLLVDGIRQNDPLTAHFNSNIPINKVNIAQIEVIKGAVAASYGADAVAGIIHIKTKTFLNEEGDKKILNAKGNAALGRDGLILISNGVYGKNKKFSYALSTNTAIAKGEAIKNTAFGNINLPTNEYYNNHFNVNTITSSLSYNIDNLWKVFFRLGYDKRDIGAKYFYTNLLADESVEVMDLVHSQIAIKRKTKDHELTINMGHRTMHDVFTFNPAYPSNRHQSMLTSLNIDYSTIFSQKIKLLLGSRYSNRKIESTDRGDHEDNNFAGYAILNYKPAPFLSLILSQRIEHDTNFKSHYLPQVNIAYSIKKITWHAGVGKSIRGADYTERFVSFKIPNLYPGRNIGNPDLKAEESWSYDIGLDYIDASSTYPFLFKIVWFQRFSNNLIDYGLKNSNDITNINTLQEDKNYLYAQNIENVEVNGTEIELKKTLPLVVDKSRITLFSNITILQFYNSGLGVFKSKSNPNLIYNMGINLNYNKLTCEFLYNYSHREEQKELSISGDIQKENHLVNAKLSLSLLQNLFVYLQVSNLLNVDYQEVLGAKLPDRWFLFGIEWNINRD